MTPLFKENKVTKSVFKILTGVIIGSAVGSILGLTLAPKHGAETRELIKNTAKALFSKGKGELPKKSQPGFVKRVLIRWLTKAKHD